MRGRTKKDTVTYVGHGARYLPTTFSGVESTHRLILHVMDDITDGRGVGLTPSSPLSHGQTGTYTGQAAVAITAKPARSDRGLLPRGSG